MMKMKLDMLGTAIRNRDAHNQFKPVTLTLEFDPYDDSSDPNSIDYLVTVQADRDSVERADNGTVCIRAGLALSELLQLISKISQELANCQYDLQEIRKAGL